MQHPSDFKTSIGTVFFFFLTKLSIREISGAFYIHLLNILIKIHKFLNCCCWYFMNYFLEGFVFTETSDYFMKVNSFTKPIFSLANFGLDLLI